MRKAEFKSFCFVTELISLWGGGGKFVQFIICYLNHTIDFNLIHFSFQLTNLEK